MGYYNQSDIGVQDTNTTDVGWRDYCGREIRKHLASDLILDRTNIEYSVWSKRRVHNLVPIIQMQTPWTRTGKISAKEIRKGSASTTCSFLKRRLRSAYARADLDCTC
jgi:hypothetical protein